MGHHHEHKVIATFRGAFWLLIFPGIPILMVTAIATLQPTANSQPPANALSTPSAALDADPFTPAPVSELPEEDNSTSFEDQWDEYPDEQPLNYWS